MGFKPKYTVITGSMGDLGDRFLTTGYKEGVSLEDKLAAISKIEGIAGVELCFDPDGQEHDAAQMRKLLSEYRLAAPVVNAPMTSKKAWKFGTFSNRDRAIRQEAEKITKQTMDFAESVGAGIVNLWMGQDGHDYSFQADYTEQWENMVTGIRACADYKPGMQLSLEFKPREPRNRALLDTYATTLLMAQEIARANVGITIDNGHVFQIGANMSQAVELCGRSKKLFNMHMNDNYGSWDDDMIVGSVRTVEYLELLYVLRKIDYSGWLSIDIFPFREDAFKSTEESIAVLELCNNWVEKLGMKNIQSMIREGDVTKVLKTIRTSLYK
jgi:xylose isomerase